MSLSDKILKASQDANPAGEVRQDSAQALMPHVLRALDILQEHVAVLEEDMEDRRKMRVMLNDLASLVEKHGPDKFTRVLENALRLMQRENVTPDNYEQKREQLLAQLCSEMNPPQAAN